MTIASLLIAASAISSPVSDAAVYRVVDIRQERSHAGKLGERVRETLVLESGSQRYTVRVDGKFHTNISGRAGQVRKGDRIFLMGRSNPVDGVIRRDDIRKTS